MSRSFFPTCSSLKVEMEEMSKELDDLRSEVEALTAECRAKADLADGLRRAGAEQAQRLREATAEAERQAREVAARDGEVCSARAQCEELAARLAEKERALRHLCAAHEGLKGSLRERTEGLEAEKRDLAAALEESEARRLEQEAAARSSSEEVVRLRRILSEKEKKCSDAEQRALAPREVMMRDEMLLKMEEEKAAVEGKLKWKAEQFRHLEEALRKVQDEFKGAKREWGSDRSTLVDQIGSLEANLDSKTRIADEFRSRLEMCSQALAHEEGRRKMLEAEMAELRRMYGNVVSEYEEARSTIESLTAKRDGEIATLRSSLAEKVTLLKEMEYGKARLEQDNEELRSSLKEYQEAQIGGADAVVSLKSLREKFRALEQTHRICTEKLREREAEWKSQMGKLGNDLDRCLSQLDSKDTLIGQLQNDLLSSNSLLELQVVENWEASTVLIVIESKFFDSCSFVGTLELNMQQRGEILEKDLATAKKQLEEKNCAIAQSQAEQAHQLKVIATLQGRVDQLEYMEQEHEELQRQLCAYKGMLDNASRSVQCLKGEASEKENNVQEKLRKTLSDLDEAQCALSEQKSQLKNLEINLHQQKQTAEHLRKLKLDMETELKGYIDNNHVLQRDLDAALTAKMEAEESLREENKKLLAALSDANCALSERKSDLSQFELTLHQQKQAVDHLEKVRVDMETELNGYMNENCKLKRDLDAALYAKMEAEQSHREEKEKLLGALDEVNCALSERKSELSLFEVDLLQQKQSLEHLEKLKLDTETELKSYMNENSALKRDLDLSLIAKLGAEESLTKEKEKLSSIIYERDRSIKELQQYITMLEEDSLGQKLDVASLIKSEVEKTIQEVNTRYSKIVEVFDKKLLELETRLGFFEQKYTCREHEITEMFDQEEADWYTLIADKEKDITDIQLVVESVQLDIKQLLGAAAEKLAQVQLEVQQLYGFAENLISLYLIQEHDNFFKDMLIAEFRRDLEVLQANFVLEKAQSADLMNALENLKTETKSGMLEKANEHLKVADKLNHLEERNESLEQQLEELKSRTEEMCNVIVQDRKELVDGLTGLTDSIGATICRDEDLMTSMKRILQKVNNEETIKNSGSKQIPSSEKINSRSSAPLIGSKSVHLQDRRSPLKEHNF